jgi:hypothetical protein
MQSSLRILIPSKDRAMQLLALLESLESQCTDFNESDVVVLYKTSTRQHYNQYIEVKRMFPGVLFRMENNIASDFIDIVENSKYALLLCDDTLFVRDFELLKIVQLLEKHSDCIGFSLRLGKNVLYSYPHNCAQDKVVFTELGGDILKFNWTLYKCDFGYPMELSSSFYRSADILQLAEGVDLHTLHHIESSLWNSSKQTGQWKPNLLCFTTSHAFSNPMNLTSIHSANRFSKREEFSVSKLAELFDKGFKIDILPFDNIVPISCHQEFAYSWIER